MRQMEIEIKSLNTFVRPCLCVCDRDFKKSVHVCVGVCALTADPIKNDSSPSFHPTSVNLLICQSLQPSPQMHYMKDAPKVKCSWYQIQLYPYKCHSFRKTHQAVHEHKKPNSTQSLHIVLQILYTKNNDGNWGVRQKDEYAHKQQSQRSLVPLLADNSLLIKTRLLFMSLKVKKREISSAVMKC